MYQFSYNEIQTDSVADAKDRERQVLSRSIDLLSEARDRGPGSREAVDAIQFVNRIWTTFLEDLASPENELPKELRANLISIGLWLLREAEEVRQGRSQNFEGLIEVSQIIRDENPMKNTLKISLKANEKIYVNGAVIRADRKVSLEFLNDVQFLLQSHVLQAEDASTPLRQLYFIVQIMLMDPAGAGQAQPAFRATLTKLLGAFRDEHVLSSLKYIDRLVVEGQVYEALKAIRGLYPLEDEILGKYRASDEPMPLATAVGE